MPWEVLIIDNASTDGTGEFAQSCWQNGPVPLRLIGESRLGVRYARERGFSEARYEFLAFVDDDNWIAHDWVRTAYGIIYSDSHLGAVGSVREPAFETASPAWFDDVHSLYAVLTERDLDQMTGPLEYLPTAGLCVRKTAWNELIQNGFRFQLTGTVGENLQGGEDAELTIALRLSGWKLRIDRRLTLRHFMPRHRLEWKYLCRLVRNYGTSHVLLDAYSEHSLSLGPGVRRWVSDRWWYQLVKSLGKVAQRPRTLLGAFSADCERQKERIEVEQQFGRALGLLKLGRRYGTLRREIRLAPWRCADLSLTARVSDCREAGKDLRNATEPETMDTASGWTNL